MDPIRRLFDHMYWADDRLMALLGELRVSPDGEAEVTRLFGHVIAAEQVWLCRVTGEDPSKVSVWPDRSIAATVRRTGGEPVNTDFITLVREQS